MGPERSSDSDTISILECLVNAQALLQDCSSSAEAARSVARTLQRVPGVGGVAVCFWESGGLHGNLEADCCESCPALRNGSGDPAEWHCALSAREGVESIAAQASGPAFGQILLTIESRLEFERFRPFVNGFAQAAALHAQNRRLAAKLRAEPNGSTRAFLQSVIDAIPEGLMVINRDFTVALANRAVRAGEARLLSPGASCYQLSHKRESRCDDSLGGCPVTLVLEDKQTVVVEHCHLDGQQRESIVEVLAAPIFDEHGEVVQIVESVRDITERKGAEQKQVAALQEKEVLLREIHHRVKNNMQVIVSLLRIQARRFSDERRERVKAMALVHEVLYQSKNLARIDFSAYLEKLCRGICKTHGVAADGVTIAGKPSDVSLGIDQGIAVGLIVCELVSNAFKHAFPAGQPGSVCVGLSILESGEVELTVRDDGRGLSDEIEVGNWPSLGLNLVSAAVTGELGGSIEVEREAGTCFRIRFRCKGVWSGE